MESLAGPKMSQTDSGTNNCIIYTQTWITFVGSLSVSVTYKALNRSGPKRCRPSAGLYDDDKTWWGDSFFLLLSVLAMEAYKQHEKMAHFCVLLSTVSPCPKPDHLVLCILIWPYLKQAIVYSALILIFLSLHSPVRLVLNYILPTGNNGA